MYRDVNGKPLTDDLTIIFLELSKLEALLKKPVEELSDIEMWAIFLRYASDKRKRSFLNKILKRKEGIMLAAQILDVISKDEKERMLYESQLLFEADQDAEWRYRERTAIKKGMEKGMKKGIEKGMEKGIEKGMEKGIEKGMEKSIKKGIKKGALIVAKNLILKGFPLDVIADSTGISIETLKKL